MISIELTACSAEHQCHLSLRSLTLQFQGAVRLQNVEETITYLQSADKSILQIVNVGVANVELFAKRGSNLAGDPHIHARISSPNSYLEMNPKEVKQENKKSGIHASGKVNTYQFCMSRRNQVGQHVFHRFNGACT